MTWRTSRHLEIGLSLASSLPLHVTLKSLKGSYCVMDGISDLRMKSLDSILISDAIHVTLGKAMPQFPHL